MENSRCRRAGRESDPEVLTRLEQAKIGSEADKKGRGVVEAVTHWQTAYLTCVNPGFNSQHCDIERKEG